MDLTGGNNRGLPEVPELGKDKILARFSLALSLLRARWLDNRWEDFPLPILVLDLLCLSGYATSHRATRRPTRLAGHNPQVHLPVGASDVARDRFLIANGGLFGLLSLLPNRTDSISQGYGTNDARDVDPEGR